MEDASRLNPFVCFAQTLLTKPALSQTIYHLQHNSGFNINVLFYLLWLAKMKYGRLTKRHIKILQGQITVWHQCVIVELKYTRAMVVNHTTPAAIKIRCALEEEIMKAHEIEQHMLYESKLKNQALRRTSNQQLADACASIIHYCELKNDLLTDADQTAFIQLFSTVFDDVDQPAIEKNIAMISDQFKLFQMQPAQHALWQESV